MAEPIDWRQRQRDCPKCRGSGYLQSGARHASGRGPAYAGICECQPRTIPELAEAAEQERDAEGKP